MSYTATDSEQNKDITMIMRQTECYDITTVRQKLAANNNDVMETIYDILGMGTIDTTWTEKAVDTEDPQEYIKEIRKVIEEKEGLYHTRVAEEKEKQRMQTHPLSHK